VNDKLLRNIKIRQLCAIDPEGALKPVKEIVEKPDRVFLWVMSVLKPFLNGLVSGDSPSYLRKRLE
jgi:hypothetical protein